MNVVTSKAAQMKLSLESRIKRARDDNVAAGGERLAPENIATVAKRRRANFSVHRVDAVFTIVFHLDRATPDQYANK